MNFSSMPQSACFHTPTQPLTFIRLASPALVEKKAPRRIGTQSSHIGSPFPLLLQPATAAFLRRGTIANPGSTQGLRAKFGRFFSFSGSGTSSAASRNGTESTTAVVAPQPREVVRKERAGVARPVTDSAAASAGIMQTFYISHGSPMLPLQHDFPANEFLVRLGMQTAKPKAILIISAHWDTTEPTVTSGKTHETIHDFYGFPKELYKLRYDAPGDPELAQRVLDLLKEGGFPKAKKDERRGLDHGAWVPLLIMYPEKDVPVVQLSVQYRKDGAHHYKVGQALASLKNEGVIVIGSGSATHNLRAIDFEATSVEPWALAFDNWLNDAFCKNLYEEMINYKEKAPYARKAHPTPDHFLPAIVAIGAAGPDAVGERIHSSWDLGTLSMASFVLKAPPPSAAASA